MKYQRIFCYYFEEKYFPESITEVETESKKSGN